MLDYILPQVAKLSKTLQTEKLDLTIISALVDATLLSVDDALEPAANWVQNFLDLQGDLQEATNTLTQQILLPIRVVLPTILLLI